MTASRLPTMDRLKCARELGARPSDVDTTPLPDAMKRDHDTEPGPPPLEEPPPSSQSRPRPITARGIGQPAPPPIVERNNDTVMETDARPGVPRATMTTAPAARPSPPVYENDSIDEALEQIGNRRHAFPVSLERGWKEHAALRVPPKRNDTFPAHGHLVLDVRTDPGERPKLDAREDVTVPPLVVPRRRTGVLAAVILVSVLIGVIAAVGALNGTASPIGVSTLTAVPAVPSATASAFQVSSALSAQASATGAISTAPTLSATAASANAAPTGIRTASSASRTARGEESTTRPAKPTKTSSVRGAEFMSEDP